MDINNRYSVILKSKENIPIGPRSPFEPFSPAGPTWPEIE